MEEDAKNQADALEELKKQRAGLSLMPDTLSSVKLVSRKALNDNTRWACPPFALERC